MQSGDLRARLFRMALGKLYRQAWSLYVQYDSKSLRYRFAEDSLEADPVALHDQYELEPKGGMDMTADAAGARSAIRFEMERMRAELDKRLYLLEQRK